MHDARSMQSRQRTRNRYHSSKYFRARSTAQRSQVAACGVFHRKPGASRTSEHAVNTQDVRIG
jgi:hypothetical protein